MDWSEKQGHILTGGGRLVQLYRPPTYTFTESELPHYHKIRDTTWKSFQAWHRAGRRSNLVAGVWTRPLFVGGWLHSDNVTGETVFNLQTPSIFLDMRIPIGPDFSAHSSLHSMTLEELKLFARRHAFAGYTVFEGTPAVGVRHHAIDWNFVGGKRPRPNKWRIEVRDDGQVWKEWGIARDEHGQHLYMERWEKLPASSGPFLALRRQRSDSPYHRDAFLIVCGDHFGMIEDRPTPQPFDPAEVYTPGLTALVDEAVRVGDRDKAQRYLSLTACHGRVRPSAGKPAWTIDFALHPWMIGRQAVRPGALQVRGPDTVQWNEETWVIVENTFDQVGLVDLFTTRNPPPSRL